MVDLDNLKVLGGWAGVTEVDPDVQDIPEYETILSGDLGEGDFTNTIVKIGDIGGIEDVTTLTLLEGFTIKNGEGSAGAGIRCGGAADVWPHIRECTLIDNTATSSFGQGGGGAIKTSATHGPTADDFLIIRNCTMTGNKATGSSGRGGAVSIWSNPNQTALVNCTLQNNQAPGSSGCGGGIHVEPFSGDDSEVHIVATTFQGNSAGESGGAISTKAHTESERVDVFLVNSLVAGNVSVQNGGGIYNLGSDLRVINSTFSDNLAGNEGGAYHESQTAGNTSAAVNSIFWENTDAGGAGHEIYNAGVLCLSYSIVDGGKAEIGGATTACVMDCAGSTSCLTYDTLTNLDADPKFIDAGGGDYRVHSVTSPAIDGGDESEVPQDEFDANENLDTTELTPDRDLNDRKSGAEVDMGAYEVDCSCPADLDDGGVVGFSDLLSVLNAWGPCVGCPQDLDGDDVVGFSDLLTILSDWGPCPCTGGAVSSDDCADYDLGQNCECRDTLLDLIENGTTNQSENARCWLDHYITCHEGGCNGPAPDCPDDDPCGNH